LRTNNQRCRVAVCCSVLQCVAVCCSVLRTHNQQCRGWTYWSPIYASAKHHLTTYICMYIFQNVTTNTVFVCTYIRLPIGKNHTHQYVTFSTHVHMHIFQNNIADTVHVCTCIESLLESFYIHQNVTLTTNVCMNMF